MKYISAIWLLRLLTICAAIFITRKQDMDYKKAFSLASAVALVGLIGIVTLSQQNVISLNEDMFTTWLILSIVLLMAILVFNLNRQYETEKRLQN